MYLSSKIKEVYFFLLTLTAQKIQTIFFVKLGYLLSLLFRKPIVLANPYSLSIEPTNTCNLRCPQCITGTHSLSRPIGFINLHSFKQIIDDVHRHCVYLMIYFQGEPFLHPQFFEMIKYAREKNIFIVTSTNGHFLTTENCRKLIMSGLHKLIISVDGTTQESYEKYRQKGSLSTVLDGVSNIYKIKKELKSLIPIVELQFLVFKHNQHQLKEFEKLSAMYNADYYKFKSAQIYNVEKNYDLLPTKSKYSRYNKKNGKYQIKNRLKNYCPRLWDSIVISWDEKIFPCCFDKNGIFNMGKTNNKGWLKCYHSEYYNDLRLKIIRKRRSIEICKNCVF